MALGLYLGTIANTNCFSGQNSAYINVTRILISAQILSEFCVQLLFSTGKGEIYRVLLAVSDQKSRLTVIFLRM
jgi:hypothetical protein